MTRHFSVAVIGCGLIGCKRIGALSQDCSLKYVYDVIPSNAQRAAHLVNYPVEIAPSLDTIIEDTSIDIVIVATSHQHLAPISIKAASHGHHLLVEKPGAMNLEQLRQLQVTADQEGVIVHVGYNHRFHPALMKANALVKTGRYGSLLWIRGRYGHGGRIGYEREWRTNPAVSGGGELVDQGSHLIDLCRFIAGDVSLAFSELQTTFWDTEVEDNAFIALRPTLGGLAWLHASWTEWKNTFSFEITLETAKIEITGLGGSYGVEQLKLFEMQQEMGPPHVDEQTWESSDLSWNLEIVDLVSHVKSPLHVPIGATLADAIAVWQIIDEAYSK